MVARYAIRTLALVAMLGLASACEPGATVAPVNDAPEIAAAVTIPTTDIAEVVWVCKDAPSGVFDFTVTATIVVPGTTVNVLESNPQIAADNCVKVAEAGNGNQITVTETPATGYNFDRIEAYYVKLDGTMVPDPAGTIYTPTISRSFGDLGRIFVFYNVLPPSTGCTLTQGYWKTHSEYGPAPYDDTWAMLADGADTPFFLSGQSWFDVFWTPVKGNPYYILAHQYAAAALNVLAGADPSAVSTELADAVTLLSTYTPFDVATIKENDKHSPTLTWFKDTAEVLDDYNNGLIGPGHCSGGPVDF